MIDNRKELSILLFTNHTNSYESILNEITVLELFFASEMVSDDSVNYNLRAFFGNALTVKDGKLMYFNKNTNIKCSVVKTREIDNILSKIDRKYK
jgi:hypothetical protein